MVAILRSKLMLGRACSPDLTVGVLCAWNKNAVSITLEKGDLLLVDNHTSVHARSAFTPKYDGKDRWLQRAGILSKEVPPQFVTPHNQLVINI